ncbi:MAG: DUF3299 domain-containing protein [Bacteroidota bacterium]
MRPIKILPYLLLVILLTLLAPEETPAQHTDSDQIWKTMLSDVRVRYTWSVKHGAYITRARFGEQVQQLDGQEVTLKGFFLAADLTGNLFVLSNNPMATCFFCGVAGIESVIEIEPHPDDLRIFKRLRTDNYIEVKGKLQLNPDDFERLIYILKDTRIIKF